MGFHVPEVIGNATTKTSCLIIPESYSIPLSQTTGADHAEKQKPTRHFSLVTDAS